jgi:hypothetical protein
VAGEEEEVKEEETKTEFVWVNGYSVILKGLSRKKAVVSLLIHDIYFSYLLIKSFIPWFK